MTIDERRIKQDQLSDIVCMLCEKQYDAGEIQATILSLASIYSEDFRHSYSQFYHCISRKLAENGEAHVLEQNLREIERVVCENTIRILDYDQKHILKLCDHVSLEVQRYQAGILLSERIEVAERNLDNAIKGQKEATEALEKAQKKLEGAETNFISILSIFSAVVLAFFGGFSYITNAISSVSSSPLMKLALIVLVAGLVVYNILMLALNFICKMTGRRQMSTRLIVIVNVIFVLLIAAVIVVSIKCHIPKCLK